MDVARLDSSTYLPDELVEGYSSMIWTERYKDAGEFQMKIPKISYARGLIPEGSLITLLDTREVMIVETHNIEKDDEGNPELTITGRTFETFLENRDLSTTLLLPANNSYFIRTLTSYEMAEYYLWDNVVGSPSGGAATVDWLPNVVVSDSVVSSEARIYYEASTVGEKYAKIRELFNTGGYGVRNIRPNSDSATLVSFDSNGNPIKTPTSDVTQLRMDVYTGFDRTRGQSVNTPVVLSYDAGDITDPQYLFNIKDVKNVAVVKVQVTAEQPSGQKIYYVNGASASTSGLDRRVLSIDASDIPYSSDPSYENAVQTRALTELAKHNQRTLFGGEISPIAHYHYNEHYSLGDQVTLAAEYGFEQTMLVSEFVRTEDESGDRGYPTLVVAT